MVSTLRRSGSKSAPLTDDMIMESVGYLPDWSPFRIRLAVLFNSYASDIFLSAVVLFNLVVVVIETDMQADEVDPSTTPWVALSNTLLLAFYVFEVIMRIWTFRKWFFKSHINLFDLFIVSLDLVITLLELTFGHLISMTFLRVFRLTRLRRSVSVMMLNPELSLLIRGMKDTGKTLFWGTLMIMVMLLMWAILAVQWIHPVNQEVAALDRYRECDRCARAFESVMRASLTFYQQLVVGDAWSEVTIPIMEHAPLTAVFFIGVHVTVSIGLMNLLLAVIVDRANAAQKEDMAEMARQEEQEKSKLRKKLTNVFSEMDDDGSGTLTLNELKHGYKTNRKFSTIMSAMDIEEDDLDIVYCILEGSGHQGVNYEEFVDQLWKLKSQDQHTLLMFIKFYIIDVRNKVVGELGLLEQLCSKQFGNMHDNISGLTRSQMQQEEKHAQALMSRLNTSRKGLDDSEVPVIDVQGIISSLTACISQELRQQISDCRYSGLGDLCQQRGGKLQPMDAPDDFNIDIDQLALSEAVPSRSDVPGPAPVSALGNRLGSSLHPLGFAPVM